MIRAVAFVLLIQGCAAVQIASEAPKVEPEVLPVLALLGRFGIGHACPVEGRVFTAAHVAVSRRLPVDTAIPLTYAWSQGSSSGYAETDLVSQARDVGLLALSPGDVPIYNEFSDGPVMGDEVSWYEYAGLKEVRRTASIESIVAGYIGFDSAPYPGASGSCLFDSSGKVLGVVVWRLTEVRSNWNEPKMTGAAASLWGKWIPEITP